MDNNIFTVKRKNYIELGEIFFWTASINKWQKLLRKDAYKIIIVDSLQYLSDNGKIDVFAFVLMPNHIHLIWRVNEMNGKESAQGSFLKYTAHAFKKMLETDPENNLTTYAVHACNKGYEFWQRDPLAVHLYTKEVAWQKLDYTHYNPCTPQWHLVNDPCDYRYSSAKFYMLGVKEYSFLKDLRDEF